MSSSTNTVTVRLASHKVSSALAAVAKAHGKLVKAAAKANQDAPVAPTYEVSAPHVILVTGEGGVEHRTLVTDVTITFPKPALAGWEFAAVIEPLEGGNLVKSVPGRTVTIDTTPFRTGSIKCDHCNTIRKRTETFIVVADGSDENVPTGTVKQVGRNCLASFLGGKSAAAILASFNYETILREEGEGGYGGCSYTPVYLLEEVLAWTCGSVREYGWTSRGAARDSFDGKQATADHVLFLLNPPPFGASVTKWKNDVALCTPTEDEKVKATAALEWARNLEGKNDYEQNLKLVATQVAVEGKHLGILCSAVSGYERYCGNQVKYADRAKVRAASEFVGTVKDKVEVKVVVEGVFDVDTQYGTLHINKFRDEAGNTLVWKTGSFRAETGKTLCLKGTVKAHTEYKGEKQTELTRCKEIS